MSQVHPIQMLLWCPACHAQHVDRGDFATIRTHKTHLCGNCGHKWRPANIETVGVSELPEELSDKEKAEALWCSSHLCDRRGSIHFKSDRCP